MERVLVCFSTADIGSVEKVITSKLTQGTKLVCYTQSKDLEKLNKDLYNVKTLTLVVELRIYL